MTVLIVLFLHLILASPDVHVQGDIAYEMDRPAGWVVNGQSEGYLSSISDKEGLAFICVAEYDELMWSGCYEVFKEQNQILLTEGYLELESRSLTKEELLFAEADDGAWFHFVSNQQVQKEHIFFKIIANKRHILFLTAYLLPMKNGKLLNETKRIVNSFRFRNDLAGKDNGFRNPPDLPKEAQEEK